MNIEEVKDELELHTKRNLSLSSVPLNVIKQFKAFCVLHTGDSYAVGLQRLLEIESEHRNLLPLLSHLVKEIEAKENPVQNQTERRLLTFGS